MADKNIAIAASKKIYPFIIRQPRLYRDINKIFSVEFLNAVWEADPEEIILVKNNIVYRRLQQSFIHAIAKCSKAFQGLRLCRSSMQNKNEKPYGCVKFQCLSIKNTDVFITRNLSYPNGLFISYRGFSYFAET